MKIRTVFQPDDVKDVDEAEAAQLRGAGLLLDDGPQPQTTTKGGATVTAATPAKEAGTDGGK